MEQSRTLTMQVTGRFIDLLGNQMYGGPVPSIAEFVANAWDADSDRVEITLPDDVTKPDAEIVIRDFGCGMTFEELQGHYLQIGYERRKDRGTDKTPKGRLVMGRKGIGKLAGFGIASTIKLRSIKDGHAIAFLLPYEDIKHLNQIDGYKIVLIEDQDCDEKSGVEVSLQKLKLGRNISLSTFMQSIAKRFAINSNEMKIYVNHIEISKRQLEYEWPQIKDTIELKNIGSITYWYGFLTSPISDPELRGFSIFSRKRIAQNTPFFFNLSGGINGQVGLEYLTGEISVDGIDSLEEDLITTDRQALKWDNPLLAEFEKWGLNLVKSACADWKSKKTKQKVDKFRHDYSPYYDRINRLQESEKQEVEFALDKIAELEKIDPKDFEIIADSMLKGVERESVKKIIRKISTLNASAGLEELLCAIKEWDIVHAVSVAETITGKIEIIEKFDALIQARTPEKSPNVETDMQTFLRDHIWLLGREYEAYDVNDVHHEQSLDTFIREIIKKVDYKDKTFDSSQKRFDLLVMPSYYDALIIELMRPGLVVDWDHATRIERYVQAINAGIKSEGTDDRWKNYHVKGLLIADKLDSDQGLKAKLSTDTNLYITRTWDQVLRDARAHYQDFYEYLKSKAPNDPRLQSL